MIKCPRCGHDCDMHWFPDCPPAYGVTGYEEFVTTACRDCLPRNLYVMDGGTPVGVCALTREAVIRNATS